MMNGGDTWASKHQGRGAGVPSVGGKNTLKEEEKILNRFKSQKKVNLDHKKDNWRSLIRQIGLRTSPDKEEKKCKGMLNNYIPFRLSVSFALTESASLSPPSSSIPSFLSFYSRLLFAFLLLFQTASFPLSLLPSAAHSPLCPPAQRLNNGQSSRWQMGEWQ